MGGALKYVAAPHSYERAHLDVFVFNFMDSPQQKRFFFQVLGYLANNG